MAILDNPVQKDERAWEKGIGEGVDDEFQFCCATGQSKIAMLQAIDKHAAELYIDSKTGNSIAHCPSEQEAFTYKGKTTCPGDKWE